MLLNKLKTNFIIFKKGLFFLNLKKNIKKYDKYFIY